jgi:hypothetical protein
MSCLKSVQVFAVSGVCLLAISLGSRLASGQGTLRCATHDCANLPGEVNSACVPLGGGGICDWTLSGGVYCICITGTVPCGVIIPLQRQECDGACVDDANVSCQKAFNRCQPPPANCPVPA